ncbi:hypothetical protein BKH42_08175 [Helicobacter sp. 13S00482-2]|uniref:hypothetical protein n=1 Tax=Helicobacter sp. 13S00482-2 TaxID=1476200 RepID=UPI000BA6DD9D|nr:hypothetical protein [Helicobacter sp. 13S00482-2]PAF53021.1 hypothetical protein BKH42_08175 [Helicobacter sp. 13S00482-2]
MNEYKKDFEIVSQTPTKSDYNTKLDVDSSTQSLSDLTHEYILADLEKLANKHPEMFDKPSDVFKLIRKVLENPTHFYRNNILDYSLVVRYVETNKIGKLAIDKESGKLIHATKVRDRDLERLGRVDQRVVGTSTLPTSLHSSNEDSSLDANEAKACSPSDNHIMPKQLQPNIKPKPKQKSKSNEGLGKGMSR